MEDNKRKINTVCIVGFILSIFTCIISIITCVIGLKSAKENNERGRGLAKVGILISFLKILLIILAFILFAINTDVSIEDKCKKATNCTNNEYGSKTCIINHSDGVEEEIVCEIEEHVTNGTLPDEEDLDIDTTDYDKED